MKNIFMPVWAGCLILSVLLMLWECPHALATAATAEQAVYDLRRAIDMGDVPLLDATVDMEGIIGQAVDIFLEDARTPEAQTTLPPMLAVVLSSVDASPQTRAMARSLLQREAGEFVRYGVRSGHFSGTPREAPPPAGLLAPLFADASLGRKEIYAIGKATTDGAVVYVPFMLRDHGNGKDYPVQALVNKQDGHWRITGLHTLRVLLEQIRRKAVE